jgi:hypothetical protein
MDVALLLLYLQNIAKMKIEYSILGMWWLSYGDVVAQLSGCGGSVERMWWLS